MTNAGPISSARLPARSRRPGRPRARRGMTLVELSIGLAITAMIGAAVTSFTFATANAWRSSSSGQTAENAGHVTAVRVQDVLRSARLFGAWRAGDVHDASAVPSAAVLIWAGDRNGDGLIQQSEIALLEYDPAESRLYLRTQPAPKVDLVWNHATFTAPAAIDTFRTVGTRVPVLSNVRGASFVVRHNLNSTVRPRLEYRIKVQVGETVVGFAGVASLRAPGQTPP